MNCSNNTHVLVEYDGSTLHYSPKAIERSYSPLIETEDKAASTIHKETWKLSTTLLQCQNMRNSTTTIKCLPQEPPHITSSSMIPQIKSKRKQLPPIPMTPTQSDPYYDSHFSQYHSMVWLSPLSEASNSYYEDRRFDDYQQYHQKALPFAVSSEHYSKEDYPYTTHWMDHQPRLPLSSTNDYYVHSPTESPNTEEHIDDSAESPAKEGYHCSDLSTEGSQSSPTFQNLSTGIQNEKDKSVRQITVKCITDDYRVWITIEPEETGKSVAKKIESLASFRTRRVTSITTASGRKVALNKNPIFMHWTSIDTFQHGETWTVTWGPLKKPSLVDVVLSKFIQV